MRLSTETRRRYIVLLGKYSILSLNSMTKSHQFHLNATLSVVDPGFLREGANPKGGDANPPLAKKFYPLLAFVAICLECAPLSHRLLWFWSSDEPVIWSTFSRHKYPQKQECIPVGCVPPTAVAAVVSTRNPPGPGTPQDQTPHREQAPPGTRPPLRTEFLTHACENITLPQTSFAGGN